MKDKNGSALIDGSIIDIHQTVNGQSRFFVLTINPLDIRYGHDINRKYEYNKRELIAPCRFTGDIDYEIIGNIYSISNAGS